MASRCSTKMVKAFDKFNADLQAFINETSDTTGVAPIYEDAFTPREVRDFRLYFNGKLTWVEDGKKEAEQMFDDDEAREWLKFWKANLRRAKKYWSMDAEELDKIYDFEKEDITVEE